MGRLSRRLAGGSLGGPVSPIVLEYLLDAQQEPIPDFVILVAVIRMVALCQNGQVLPGFSEVDAAIGYGGWWRWYSLIDDNQRDEQSQVNDAGPYCNLYRTEG